MPEPPSEPPEEPPKKRGNPENLNRGVPENVERGPDGKLRKKAEQPLSEETQGRLEVMRHVERTGPGSDRTYQQRNQRILLTKNPVAFQDRLAELEREEAEGVREGSIGKPMDLWDGTWPCPTCKHEPEKPIEDAGAQKILALMRELREGLT